MPLLRSLFARLVGLWSFWMRDIRSRKSTKGKLASVAVGLFAMCCVCGTVSTAVRSTGQAMGIVATNTATALPTMTFTPVPTRTPAPSRTPAPTETAVPPTQTAAPTETVAPTETIAPTKPPARRLPTPTRAPVVAPTPAPQQTSFDNNGDGKVTCKDFRTQAAAQRAYAAGETQLDGNDNDGRACESLP